MITSSGYGRLPAVMEYITCKR